MSRSPWSVSVPAPLTARTSYSSPIVTTTMGISSGLTLSVSCTMARAGAPLRAATTSRTDSAMVVKTDTMLHAVRYGAVVDRVPAVRVQPSPDGDDDPGVPADGQLVVHPRGARLADLPQIQRRGLRRVAVPAQPRHRIDRRQVSVRVADRLEVVRPGRPPLERGRDHLARPPVAAEGSQDGGPAEGGHLSHVAPVRGQEFPHHPGHLV